MVLQFTLELFNTSFDKVNRPLTLSGHHNGKNTVYQNQMWLGGLRETASLVLIDRHNGLLLHQDRLVLYQRHIVPTK